MDRKANQKDEKQIYQLMCQLEQTQLPYDRFAEIFRQQLAKEQYYCLVWEEEGRVVGVLNLRWEGQLHHAGKVAEILELIVSPDCRNQGVGRKMFARALPVGPRFWLRRNRSYQQPYPYRRPPFLSPGRNGTDPLKVYQIF